MQYDRQGFVEAEDGTRLFYGVRGEGPTVVLNDGIGCDGFAWKYLQPELAQKYQVVHWHYRGHGRSGAPRDPARLDIVALARDLQAVLADVGVEKAAVLGHSMGTQVCLEYYRLAPDRTTAIGLLCGSYGKVTETFHGSDVLKNILPGVVEAMQKHRMMARALWGRVPSKLAFRIARLTGEVDRLAIREEDFRVYWDHINLISPMVFLPMLRLAGEHSAEDLLAQIDVPTLVIAAERDTFTPKELAQTMAENIADAEFLLLEGASHAAPVEHPRLILHKLMSFLDEATRG